MKRLEVMGKSFQFTGDNPPQYKSLSFQVQVIRDQYNVVRAEFFVEGQELQTFLDGGMNWEQLAEEKMKWILETNTTPVDAYMLEGIQREQREIVESVEAAKQEAVAAASDAAAEVARESAEMALKAMEASLKAMEESKNAENAVLTAQNEALQSMIVELTLMLSMLGDMDGEPETGPPVEEPPKEGAPDDPEPETPADPVVDDTDTTPIDEGGEGGE